MPEKKRYTTVLSIAGSDSIGGAGIQADLKTCTALGCYAMTAITSITAQNTLGVKDFETVSEKMMNLQLEAVCEDIIPDAVKIGMVPTPEIANIIADALEKYQLKNIVVDPVMVSTSGSELSCSPAMKVIVERIFPLATVITPNFTEASTLMDDQEHPTAEDISKKFGDTPVLLKGGHDDANDLLADILYWHGNTRSFVHQRIFTPNTHGTGCSLSSAIACYLAKDMPLPQACGAAIEWLRKALIAGADYDIGHGYGPVNHLFNIL